MECFTGLWARHSAPASKSSSAWFIGGVDQQFIPAPNTTLYETTSTTNSCDKYFSELLVNNKSCDLHYSFEDIIQQSPDEIMAEEGNDDLRNILKNKAEKHRNFYKNLTGSTVTDNVSSDSTVEMAQVISKSESTTPKANNHALKSLSLEQVNKCLTTTTANGADPDADALSDDEMVSSDLMRVNKRQRRTGVYEICKLDEDKPLMFKSVKLLRDNYLEMLKKTTKSLGLNVVFNKEGVDDSKLNSSTKEIDESLLLPPPSGYCSSTASGASDDEREHDKNWYQKSSVARCGSSDSAMGQSDEEIHHTINSNWGETREELDEDNVPYRQPVSSPYSPRGSVDHVKVPSKTIIEAKFVPLPLDRKCSDCISEPPGGFDESGQNASGLDSRRHSCFTDDGDEQPRYRYWRTPSVVVSDYSDDIMGLTLEDIEYIRNQRKETSSSPDSSLHSSCSNLNYCGSVISSLDSEFVFKKPFRKSSDCSTCSTLSGDDEPAEALLQPRQREVSAEFMTTLCKVIFSSKNFVYFFYT